MLLMIDNYDSFSWTIAGYFSELGQQVKVIRNDAASVSTLAALNPSRLVISPGPCTPAESGISVPALEYFCGRIPVLGICLGHQCIGQVFGADVAGAEKIMHGKTSEICHDSSTLFRGLPASFRVNRYHSLALHNLPAELRCTAWTSDNKDEPDTVMAIEHRQEKIFGVQFHPESVLTEHGHQILRNFLSSDLQEPDL